VSFVGVAKDGVADEGVHGGRHQRSLATHGYVAVVHGDGRAEVRMRHGKGARSGLRAKQKVSGPPEGGKVSTLPVK
jgi:hypothetical protein